MSVTAIVEALVTAGATPEQILAAVKAYEQPLLEKQAQQREAARQRKIAQRERENTYKSIDASRGQSVTECDTPLSPSDGFPPHPLSLTSPISPKEKPPKGVKKKNPYSEEFEEFWKIYPRKDGSKAKASEFYEQAITGGVSHEQLRSGAGEYAQDVRKNRVGRKHIAHAATWLNQRRWEATYDDSQPYTDGKPSWESAADEIRARRFGTNTAGRGTASGSDQQGVCPPETIRKDCCGAGDSVGRLLVDTRRHTDNGYFDGHETVYQ